jgi:hypothetical protein
MNFGKWIIVAFVLFGMFMAVLVAISFRQDVNLVADDYYAKELVYESQVDRIRNTKRLAVKPTLVMKAGGEIELKYAGLPLIQEGRVELFRPSDSHLDQEFTLKPVPVEAITLQPVHIEKGYYRLKMYWSMNGEPYYVEQDATLP